MDHESKCSGRLARRKRKRTEVKKQKLEEEEKLKKAKGNDKSNQDVEKMKEEFVESLYKV